MLITGHWIKNIIRENKDPVFNHTILPGLCTNYVPVK